MRLRKIFRFGVQWTALGVSAIAFASETTTISYDSLGRLVSTSTSSGPNAGLQTGTSFDPAGNRISNTVSGAPIGSTPSFSIGNIAVTEGGVAVFTIVKRGSATATFTVNYASASGTATAGADFSVSSGTLTFLDNDITKTVSVPTTNDSIIEPSETFSVTLSGAASGSTISTAVGTGTITDNDTPMTPPTFAISNATGVVEGDTLIFTINKSGSTPSAYSVDYATANGTANAGTDFTAVSGTLDFASTDTHKTISVPTVDDDKVESNETVLVNLSASTGGAIIAASQGSGIIADNDVTNQPPVAAGDSLSMQQCTVSQKNVTINDSDPDGDPLTVSTISGSGALYTTIVSASTIQFEAPGGAANYTVTYVVSDGHGGSASANLAVSVLTTLPCE